MEDREDDAVISDWEDMRLGGGREEDEEEDEEPEAWWEKCCDVAVLGDRSGAGGWYDGGGDRALSRFIVDVVGEMVADITGDAGVDMV